MSSRLYHCMLCDYSGFEAKFVPNVFRATDFLCRLVCPVCHHTRIYVEPSGVSDSETLGPGLGPGSLGLTDDGGSNTS